MFSTTDTIVAIATAAGRAGIGVVRLSGPEASAIAGRLLHRTKPLEARAATLATIRSRNDDARAIDQVVVTSFPGPTSYTGEDVVEFSAHGSPVILRQIVSRAMDEGARLAEPGEFTLRAYLNGRMDLVQAEAVADLVDAVTPLQARAAYDQLDGTLTGVLGAIDRDLFDLSARLEASLDFPEEGFHFVSRPEVLTSLEDIGARLDALARAGRRGRLIREGATVVIAGLPNAGKSSLFNALVGSDRAIVTEVAGTTRDLLSERLDIEGLALTLVDTAGLGEARDAIEAEGVRRAQQAQDVAQLVLWVIDGSVPPSGADAVPAVAGGRHLVVLSKSDQPPAVEPDGGWDAVRVSARSGAGLDELRRRIVLALTGGEALVDVPALSNVRHLHLVETARTALARATMTLAEGGTEELILVELAAARGALESIVGRRTADDLLAHIFERFCIGK